MFRCKFAGPLSGVGQTSTVSSAACLGVLGLALLAGGCASNDPSPPSWVAGPIQAFTQQEARQQEARQQVAQVPQAKATSGMRVEIEADGLPAQLAPRHRTPVADDPTEPWSPNYGTAAPTFDQRRLAEKLDAAQPQPAALSHPPHARPLSGDDLIRQAIAAHEMRRRD